MRYRIDLTASSTGCFEYHNLRLTGHSSDRSSEVKHHKVAIIIKKQEEGQGLTLPGFKLPFYYEPMKKNAARKQECDIYPNKFSFSSSCRELDAGYRDGSAAGGRHSCGLGELSENVAA